MCYNQRERGQKGNRVMAVTERERGSAAEIRELRGVVVDLASGLGRLEWQMRAMLALTLVALAVAVAILIRV